MFPSVALTGPHWRRGEAPSLVTQTLIICQLLKGVPGSTHYFSLYQVKIEICSILFFWGQPYIAIFSSVSLHLAEIQTIPL